MRILSLGLFAVLSVGCVSMTDSDSESSASENGGGDSGGTSVCSGDRDACKIEGSQIGVEGLELVLDHGTVTFHDWVPKPDSPGEYIGFSLTFEGMSAARYVVKSGTGRYPSTSTTWLHPGDDCKGISNVDFGDDDPDGGGDGGGDCDGGDGCPTPGDGEPIL
jgi:hypothetical protein